MSEGQWFTPETIQIIDVEVSWQEAIAHGCRLLERSGYVDARYQNAVTAMVKKHGPYMAIAPHIFLSHARPEEGALETAVSLVILRKGAVFGHAEHDPIHLLITFCAITDSSHLRMLAELVEVLSDPECVSCFMSASTVEDVFTLLNPIKEVRRAHDQDPDGLR